VKAIAERPGAGDIALVDRRGHELCVRPMYPHLRSSNITGVKRRNDVHAQLRNRR
jgi:hypothetical protein